MGNLLKWLGDKAYCRGWDGWANTLYQLARKFGARMEWPRS